MEFTHCSNVKNRVYPLVYVMLRVYLQIECYRTLPNLKYYKTTLIYPHKICALIKGPFNTTDIVWTFWMSFLMTDSESLDTPGSWIHSLPTSYFNLHNPVYNFVSHVSHTPISNIVLCKHTWLWTLHIINISVCLITCAVRKNTDAVSHGCRGHQAHNQVFNLAADRATRRRVPHPSTQTE